MAIVKFTITEDHLKLLSNLRWIIKDGLIVNIDDDGESYIPPFGENNIHDAINFILNGKTNLADDELKVEYSEEDKKYWDKLYSELPTCLNIILQRQSFELGSFKSKYHEKIWEVDITKK